MNLYENDRVRDALRSLAEADRNRQAPPGVEHELREKFRRRHRGPEWRLLAAAAVLLTAVSLTLLLPGRPARQEAADASRRTSAFLAIPFTEPLDPNQSGLVVRVELPRSAFLRLGVAVPYPPGPGHISADVLLGHDGMVRAVRLAGTDRELLYPSRSIP